tara:strand:+ start:115 stop:609 length:495 start_codon:yes stop_codon:yes gene_type:complete
MMNEQSKQKQIHDLQLKVTQWQKQIEALEAEPREVIHRVIVGGAYYIVDGTFNTVHIKDRGDPYDTIKYASYNYFADEKQCEAVAKHIGESFLFTRKAIEFADGYEYEFNAPNYLCAFAYNANVFIIDHEWTFKNPTTVYMSKENAKLFTDWCNEHKAELGYEW